MTEVPAKSGFEDGQGERIKFCLGCNEKLATCKCMWAAIRSLQETNAAAHIDLRNIEGQMEGLSEHIDYLRAFEKDGVFAIDDLRKRVKDIKYRLEHIVELPGELDIRLQDVERILHKPPGETLDWCVRQIRSLLEVVNRITEDDMKAEKKPHVCPVCLGLTILPVKYIEKATGEKNHLPPLICQACEGRGIVWG